MPRFVVSMCDKNTGEMYSTYSRSPSMELAIRNFPWLTEIYTSKWIELNIVGSSPEDTVQNLHAVLNWSCSCLDLDEAIMKDLNGGDSSVCSQTQPN